MVYGDVCIVDFKLKKAFRLLTEVSQVQILPEEPPIRSNLSRSKIDNLTLFFTLFRVFFHFWGKNRQVRKSRFA